MKVIIFILLALLAFMTLVCYSLLVVASEADRRAERMYRKWKEQLEYDIENNDEPVDSDYNVGIDHAICVLGTMKGADDE